MAITLRGDGNTTFDNNIGIGTTSPDEALHVHATGSTQIAAEFEASNNETYIQFSGNDDTQVLYGRDSADACIQVNASDVFKAKSGGDCQIVDGNLVLANGHGIDFSATTNSAGTMTSELLDDYEEGTFSPTVVGHTTAGTYEQDSSLGIYVKIGRMVYASVRIDVASSITGGGSGNLKITGFPYAVQGGGAFANNNGINALAYMFGINHSGNFCTFFMGSNSDAFALSLDDAGNQTVEQIGIVGGGDIISFPIMYMTTS